MPLSYSTTISYLSSDFTPANAKSISRSPNGSLTIYNNKKKELTVTSGAATYGYVKLQITLTGSNIRYGAVTFSTSNSSPISIGQNLDDVFYPCNLGSPNGYEIPLQVGVPKTLYVIVNPNSKFTTKKINVVTAVGVSTASAASIDIQYDCIVPLYEYSAGVHVYSPYDAANASKLTAKLYSKTQIGSGDNDPFPLNHKLWALADFSHPAYPYYYLISGNNNVIKVGGPYDRTFGFKNYYKVTHSGWNELWGIKPKLEIIEEGPKDYEYATTVPACVHPLMTDIGKVKSWLNKSTYTKPTLYQYITGYHSSNKEASNDEFFAKWVFSNNKFYPITGRRHNMLRLANGYKKGFASDVAFSNNFEVSHLVAGGVALGAAAWAGVLLAKLLTSSTAASISAAAASATATQTVAAVTSILSSTTSALTAAGVSSAGASAGVTVWPIVYSKVGAATTSNLVVLYNSVHQIVAQFTGAAADLFIGSHGINVITAGPGSLAINGGPSFTYLSSAASQTTTAASSAVKAGTQLATTSGTSTSSAATIGGIAASTVVLIIILVIIAIIIIIQLLEKIEKWLGEECKNFIFHYNTNPYIEIGDTLKFKDRWPDISQGGTQWYFPNDIFDPPYFTQTNNGYYCDGVYFYQQSGGVITSKEVSYSNYTLTSEDPNIVTEYEESLDVLNPTTIIEVDKLHLLPYASGQPIEYTASVPIFYSQYQENIVNIYPKGGLQTKIETKTMYVKASSSFSYTSSAAANSSSLDYLSSSLIPFVSSSGTQYTPVYPSGSERPVQITGSFTVLGIATTGSVNISSSLNAFFTHELKLEDVPTAVNVYYDNTSSIDISIGKRLYYDAYGYLGALDGYYSISGSEIPSSSAYRVFVKTNELSAPL